MSDDELPNVQMTEEASEQQGGEHPFWQDLNPDFLAGENYGLQGPQAAKTAATAYDIKGAHRRLQDMEDDELKQIPILPPGTRLQQGATYIDLHAPEIEEFKARSNMEAGPDNWYVPKADVPYWLWNKLIGVTNPERLDQADES